MFVIGHAAWGADCHLRASVTASIISKVVSHQTTPVLIQVSRCTSQSECPLVSTETVSFLCLMCFSAFTNVFKYSAE